MATVLSHLFRKVSPYRQTEKFILESYNVREEAVKTLSYPHVFADIISNESLTVSVVLYLDILFIPEKFVDGLKSRITSDLVKISIVVYREPFRCKFQSHYLQIKFFVLQIFF